MDKLLLRASSINQGQTIQIDQNNNEFKFALYLASPDLFHQLYHTEQLNPQKTDKLKYSLKKYVKRAKYRATPFGLFASCSVIKWAEESNFDLSNKPTISLDYDLHLYGTIAQKIVADSEARTFLTFQINHTSYTIKDKIRYIEFYYKGNKRYHKISEATLNEGIEIVLEYCAKPKLFNEIVQHIAESFETSVEEAQEFLSLIIDEKLLIASVYVGGLKPNSLNEIVQQLPAHLVTKFGLSAIVESIKEIDSTNFQEKIGDLKNLLATLEIPFLEKFLLQAVTYYPSNEFSLADRYKIKLEQAVKFMHAFNPNFSNPQLEEFKKRYTEQYGDIFLPLMQVLDPQNGLGYPLVNYSADESSDLNEISFPNRVPAFLDLRFYQMHQTLFLKLEQAIRKGEREISLSEADIPENRLVKSAQLPLSYAILWSISENNQVCINTIGGSSAAALIGRFGIANSEAKDLLTEIVNKENKILNNQAILAEIDHVPEDRVGNVIQRPQIREHVIPIVTYSDTNNQECISLSKLKIGVQHNRIILYSEKKKSVILPRLMNAHSFMFSQIPAYRFLAELQFQDTKPNLTFAWGVLEKQFTYFPRVTHRNIILSPEKWRFFPEKLKFIESKSSENYRIWITENKLPEKFILVEGDNRLLIDTKDPDDFLIFIGEIKNKDEIFLEESLGNSPIPGLTERASEFLSAHFNEKFALPKFDQRMLGNTDQQVFSLGQKWVYFKLYALFSVSDDLLVNHLAPLITNLKNKGLIQYFFFIKYTDPKEHLRLRFLITENSFQQVVSDLCAEFNKLLTIGLISDFVNDKYVKESFRYQNQTLDAVEEWFAADSEATMQFISVKKQLDVPRWHFAILSIVKLLDDFELNLNERLEFMSDLANAFRNEFEVNKYTNKQLDKKFRQSETIISSLINTNQNETMGQIVNQRSKNTQEVLLTIRQSMQTNNLNELLGSMVHMLLNRLFITNQRQYETIIYDFLHRYYKKQVHSHNV